MADSIMQLRRDTAANWTSSNPTLASGEPGYETDTGRLKIGDGTTAWASLAYSFDIQGVIDSAPVALDTLNELAAAVADDASFHTTVLIKSNNLSDLTNAATARASLDLEPGVDVLGYDSNLAAAVSAYDFPVADGSSGQAIKTNGSGTLSFTDLPTPGGSFTATASGSIADGDPLIINADGTVSATAVIADWSSVSNTTTTPITEFISSSVRSQAATDIEYNSDSDEYAIAYMSNSYNLNVFFATVTGGTPSFTADTNTGVALGYNHNGRFPLLYVGSNTYVYHNLDNGGNLKAYTIQNNAGVPSIGSPTTVATGITSEIKFRAVHYVADGKYLLWFSNVDDVIQCHCLTVSGTTITDESNVTFSGGAPFDRPGSAYCAADSGYYFFLAGESTATASVVYMAATVSGTTVSIATAPTTAAFPSGVMKNIARTQTLSDGTLICLCGTTSDSNAGVFAATNSSGVLTVGSPTLLEATSYKSPVDTIQKFLVDGGLGNEHAAFVGYESGLFGKLHKFTVSGTTITKTAETAVTTGTAASNEMFSIAGVPTNNEYIGIWYDYSPADLMWFKAYANESTNLTASNFVGISAGAYTDSVTATVQIQGSVDDAQTGLTAGQVYYVQTDGSLSETAGSPSVVAGVALSATTLLIKE
jgi:hypothetical protein